jgi:hypothetical protein
MNERARRPGVTKAMTTGERALGVALTTLSFGLALAYLLAAW